MDFINNYFVSAFTLDGEYVNTWSSISEAGRELNIKNLGNIRSCVVGKRNHAYGYKWKYTSVAIDLLPGEIWKPVVGFEKLYAVSNKGRVASLQYHGKKSFSIMSQSNLNGYKAVKIRDSKNGYSASLRVHRLVAEAFISNPENKPHIDHIDTDTTNNNVDNLRWVTPLENQNNPITINRLRDAIIPYNKSYEHKEVMRKILSRPVLQYTVNGQYVAEYSSMKEAANELNSTITCIKRVCDGVRKQHKGFIFKYK